MRTKSTSDKLKRHRKTFYLARRDPDRWERERNTTLSEGLREARERASVAEREAKAKEVLLNRSQQQVSVSSSVRINPGLTKLKG